MKLKLLLAPSILIIAASLLIWVVYPAYTNGVDGAREKYLALEKQKAMVANLISRLDNVKKLRVALDADVSGENTLFGYLPQNKEDEKIIENLNSLALKNSLAVLNISLAEPKADISVVDSSATADTLASTTNTGSGTSASAPIVKKIVPNKLMANFIVFGSYENTRMLLDNLNKMKRFNKVSTLEMKSTKNEDQTQNSNLQTSMTLEFDYLPDNYVVSDDDISNDIFASGVFNRKAIEDIVKNKNIDVNNVVPGVVGSSNPFMLQQ